LSRTIDIVVESRGRSNGAVYRRRRRCHGLLILTGFVSRVPLLDAVLGLELF
jgi:hypothetical protein